MRINNQSSREVVMEAVKQNGYALQYASAELQGDWEFVLEAVKHNVDVLVHTAPELMCDRDFMLAAVKQNGEALRYAGRSLRELASDLEIVLEAMAHPPDALPFASPGLLRWASPELQNGGFAAHLEGLLEHSFNVPRETFIATILRASTSTSTSSTGDGGGANNGGSSNNSSSTGGGGGCPLALLRPSAALPRSLSTVIKQLIGDYAGLRIGPKWRVIERAAANFGFVN